MPNRVFKRPPYGVALLNDPKASIYVVARRFFRGVSLIGTVEVLESAEAKKRIWRDGDTMYYKEGVTDPDYCVLKFTATRGRYYSNFKSEDFEVIKKGREQSEKGQEEN